MVFSRRNSMRREWRQRYGKVSSGANGHAGQTSDETMNGRSGSFRPRFCTAHLGSELEPTVRYLTSPHHPPPASPTHQQWTLWCNTHRSDHARQQCQPCPTFTYVLCPPCLPSQAGTDFHTNMELQHCTGMEPWRGSESYLSHRLSTTPC